MVLFAQPHSRILFQGDPLQKGQVATFSAQGNMAKLKDVNVSELVALVKD